MGIFRIIVILRITRATDFTLDAVETNYLSVLEPSLGVIIACAATLNPLLRFSQRKIAESARGLLTITRSRSSDPSRRQTGARTGAQTGVRPGAEHELADREHAQHGDVSRALEEIDRQSVDTISGEDKDAVVEARQSGLEAQNFGTHH